MQESVKEELDAEIDALLNASRSQNAQNIRNVAVDASEHLRDDRHDNPEDIYRDARELQERLDRTRREVEEASDDPAGTGLQVHGRWGCFRQHHRQPQGLCHRNEDYRVRLLA